jgi:hypothetical protein
MSKQCTNAISKIQVNEIALTMEIRFVSSIETGRHLYYDK